MTAFRATYSDWKLIKTRGVVQIVMEVPLADADAAYDVLGGMPVHGKERWFGIAALKPEEDRAKPRQDAPQDSHPDGAKRKMDWRDMQPAAQAGIRCDDPVFWAFLVENYRADWLDSKSSAPDCVRIICGVTSRAELGTNHKARVIWKQLDDQFQAWKALEHA
jgi:hypothetical protein